jgi:hypothetical protein
VSLKTHLAYVQDKTSTIDNTLFPEDPTAKPELYSDSLLDSTNGLPKGAALSCRSHIELLYLVRRVLDLVGTN